MQYIATLRIKKNNVGIAGINLGPQSCIRSAEKAFEAIGIQFHSVNFGSYMFNLKNYTESPAFTKVDDQQAAVLFKEENAKVQAFLENYYK